MSTLFDPIKLGQLQLQNRIVMAPMTRSRADEKDMPTELHVEYYRQRASAGLIISEGTHPSKNGKGYCRTPGIFSADHANAWKKVTDAVHTAGGKIVCQIMHCGRIGHPDNKAPDAETVAPSAIRANDKIFVGDGMKPMAEPRALTTEEIADVINEYRQATIYAMDAGFDGVELHCTSGYLPAQFLSTGTNQRGDQYGGSLENRLRFVTEVLDTMISVAGAGRVGMRICPGNPFNDLHDNDPEQTFAALLDKVSPKQLAYLHVIRMPQGPVDNLKLARQHFNGPLIVNDSYSANEAQQVIANEQAAAVSFGRDFIANPDLPKRIQNKVALQTMDPSTLYTPGAKGYTDYPEAKQ
ncbi:alkene reductase [Oceanicoccus sp. KOV_DT_Chl]|uniref:alkene reductase n=1 Tax=Oceanicoccus sp. KOV_DT_Chl TaxID=1904639 RepID=UPI000C7A9E3A|nr:alkene reductase [Oceanicoccus sp. KOV_DT_Chl]